MNKNKSIIFLVSLILLGIIASLLLSFFKTNTSSPAPVATSTNANWKAHTIEEIRLNFKTPEEMEVSFESQKDEKTGVAYSHTLYVQKGNGGSEGYYQLYGLYQIGEAYNSIDINVFKEELEEGSTIDEVAGFPAISGQIKGMRNRFVTHIITDIGRFSLFTAEPTEENRILTEKILKTFEFTK